MTPVSNATPLIHLARIGLLSLLRDLYGRVEAPPAVLGEVGRHVLPDVGAAEEQRWLVRTPPADASRVAQMERRLGGLGEAEALALAIERKTLLLVDERAARNLARQYGIAVRGMLGVLLEAKSRGLLTAVRPWRDRLRETGFWLDDETYDAVLDLASESLS